MNKQHVTKGPVHIGVRQPNSDKFIYGVDGTEIANCDRLTNFPDENQANAELIAEAFNVLHETGMTPRDLLDRLRAIHDGLTHCESIDELRDTSAMCIVQSTLPTKHQPVTPA